MASDEKDVKIYVLKDPRNDEIRYVGKTIRKLNHRFNGHLSAAKRGDNRHVLCWIKQLLSLGLFPVMECIETIPDGSEWENREKYWILYFKEQGYKLTNLTDGGEGPHGHKQSDATKAKRSMSLKGKKRPPEVIEKLKIAARKRTPEQLARNGLARKGKPMSDNARVALLAANIGKKKSIETRAKMSAAHRGVKHTEEAIEKMRISKRNISEETRLKMSKAAMGKKKFLGRKHTEETKRKMSVSNKGKHGKITWENVQEIRKFNIHPDVASQRFNISKGQCYKILSGKRWRMS